MYYHEVTRMRISGFDWDDGNVPHITLGHGIEPEEAEEVFAAAPFFRKTKRRHYAALGPTLSGRLSVIVLKERRHRQGNTGWDMNESEKRYYAKNRKG